MQSFGGEEDERDGSQSAGSDNDQDEAMEDAEDVDVDMDADGDQDGNGDDDENEDAEDNEEDDQDETQDLFESPTQSHSQSRVPSRPNGSTTPSLPRPSLPGQTSGGSLSTTQLAPTSNPASQATVTPMSGGDRGLLSGSISLRPTIRPEALTAAFYDIVPTIAAPHSTSINAITATPDLRWVFSGGADGYIRKFNWIDTANGKVMLTVAQRHPFVDSVTKAGVLMSYWENEEPQVKSPLVQSVDDNLSLSPVYSLAVESQGLWLLSGLDSGGINLQSVRHDEGKRITCLRQHTSAVSVLTLSQDEKSVLSGSWDKNVFDWDLNTGKVKRGFEGSGGQISVLEPRPVSTLPVPEHLHSAVMTNGTFNSNNADPPLQNGVVTNGIPHGVSNGNSTEENDTEDAQGSPANSLFNDGGNSLFGDDGDDDAYEFSRAMADEQPRRDEDVEGDTNMDGSTNTLGSRQPTPRNEMSADEQRQSGSPKITNGETSNGANNPSNGAPHSEEVQAPSGGRDPLSSSAAQETALTSDTTFMAASYDGSLRIWDRRQPNPIATILPKNVPPWCMNACWSPDGNYIYAGRRNGAVEEFSLHKGFRGAERTFKFPQGSGPVSAVRAMPNGKHLICASFDILRLYDLEEQQTIKHSTVPFLIVPGHRGGVISSLYIDPSCRYLISTAGNRGWEGATTEVLLGYEIGIGR